jgi:hypothetical protein
VEKAADLEVKLERAKEAMGAKGKG